MTVSLPTPTPLVTTVVAALRDGGPVRPLLDEQRERHLLAVRALTLARRAARAEERPLLDYQIFHIEADLRWIDHTAARLRNE